MYGEEPFQLPYCGISRLVIGHLQRVKKYFVMFLKPNYLNCPFIISTALFMSKIRIYAITYKSQNTFKICIYAMRARTCFKSVFSSGPMSISIIIIIKKLMLYCHKYSKWGCSLSFIHKQTYTCNTNKYILLLIQTHVFDLCLWSMSLFSVSDEHLNIELNKLIWDMLYNISCTFYYHHNHHHHHHHYQHDDHHHHHHYHHHHMFHRCYPYDNISIVI